MSNITLAIIVTIFFSACSHRQELIDLQSLPIHTLHIISVTPIEQIPNAKQIVESMSNLTNKAEQYQMGAPYEYTNTYFDKNTQLETRLTCVQNDELFTFPFTYTDPASGVNLVRHLIDAEQSSHALIFEDTINISGRFSGEWCQFTSILNNGKSFFAFTNKAVYQYSKTFSRWEAKFKPLNLEPIPLDTYDNNILFAQKDNCKRMLNLDSTYSVQQVCLLDNINIFVLDKNENFTRYKINIDTPYNNLILLKGLSRDLRYAYVGEFEVDIKEQYLPNKPIKEYIVEFFINK